MDASGLMDHFVTEGRADKAKSLAVFLSLAQVAGAGIELQDVQKDENLVMIPNPKAFFVPPDHHQN